MARSHKKSREYSLSFSGRSNILFKLRYWISKHPYLYIPYSKITRPNRTLTENSQLIIEGYCRSANSFAAEAFIFANEKRDQIIIEIVIY